MRDHLLFCEGDRVVLVENHPDNNRDLIIGCTGTVMTEWERGEDDLWYGVWWDEKIERGHTLNGDVVPPGCGWNVPESALRLLPEKEIPEEDIQDEDGLRILIGL